MKPATTIVTILLVGISAAHLLRLIFQVEIIAAGFTTVEREQKLDLVGDFATEKSNSMDFSVF
jgi:hypothetical protein